MKGRFAVMKKWWVLALVVTLALSLTSCGKKKKQLQSGSGKAYCEGTMGTFWVHTAPSRAQQGLIDIKLEVGDVESGDIATIVIGESQSGQYRPLISEITLYPGQDLLVGTITESDLMFYDTLAITGWQGYAGPWAEQFSDKEAYCDLPLLGTGQQMGF